MLFDNATEYNQRRNKPFKPPAITLKEIRDAVPRDLFQKNPWLSSFYLARDLILTAALYKFAFSIAPLSRADFGGYISSGWMKASVKIAMWLFYWFFQSLVGAGLFCLGHDAGHKSLYDSNLHNHTVGFLLHQYLLIPYFSWKSTHHAHHKATGSIERDENYVPYTRGTYRLPDEKTSTPFDYAEVFEETPIYSLYRMFIMQGFGWWVYLAMNTMGSPRHPQGTNHFKPSSSLFRPEQRNLVVLSNVGLVAMVSILWYMGREFFLWYYLPPYLLVNHWIVMFTFLHHSDPTIPHYRKKEWTFLRGALATVDRPLLGWMGRFFFHNISHDHVAHHLFLRAPFYNGPQITKAIQAVLKDDYNYDSTPSFYALYRSFMECRFVEDEGDIVFYKDAKGRAARELSTDFRSDGSREIQE